MENIKEALRNGNKITIYYDNYDSEAFFCDFVVGGISWASSVSPFYFCILAQVSQINAHGVQPLKLLFETQADTPAEFHQALSDYACRFLCWQWFADFNDRDNLFCVDDYLKSHDLHRRINIQPPQFGWNTGLPFVQQYYHKHRLDIPRDTILAKQLGAMGPDAKKDAGRYDFYAVGALGNVVTSIGGNQRSGYTPTIRRVKYAY